MATRTHAIRACYLRQWLHALIHHGVGICRENGPDPNLGRGRRNAARAADTAEHAAAIAERKRKQDALSKKKNEETYKRLTAQVRPPPRRAAGCARGHSLRPASAAMTPSSRTVAG